MKTATYANDKSIRVPSSAYASSASSPVPIGQLWLNRSIDERGQLSPGQAVRLSRQVQLGGDNAHSALGRAPYSGHTKVRLVNSLTARAL